MQCLSVALYKVLGKSLLSSCYGEKKEAEMVLCPRPGELCPSSLQKL